MGDFGGGKTAAVHSRAFCLSASSCDCDCFLEGEDEDEDKGDDPLMAYSIPGRGMLLDCRSVKTEGEEALPFVSELPPTDFTLSDPRVDALLAEGSFQTHIT